MSSSLPPNALTQPLAEHLSEALASPALGEWAPVLCQWLHGTQGQAVVGAVQARQRAGALIYPGSVLRALLLTPLSSVRVVILGQDPYHGPGQAQGLAFSVSAGARHPPSLRNILQEVRRDQGSISTAAASGDLSVWAEQGVLLLNTALTVEDGRPAAHSKLGWSGLADILLRAVVDRAVLDRRPLVFMLWGAHAQARESVLRQVDPGGQCLILRANHPSPLAARRPPIPFVGCGHFSQACRFLQQSDPHAPPLRW